MNGREKDDGDDAHSSSRQVFSVKIRSWEALGCILMRKK